MRNTKTCKRRGTSCAPRRRARTRSGPPPGRYPSAHKAGTHWWSPGWRTGCPFRASDRGARTDTGSDGWCRINV